MSIEVAKAVYAAINRNDIVTTMEYFDPQAVRIEPEDFPMGGTYRGLAEIKTHLEAGRGSWAEGACQPEELIVSGDKVVLLLYVKVRLKKNRHWTEGRFADVLTFKNGKVIEMRTFGKREEALEWAGVKKK